MTKIKVKKIHFFVFLAVWIFLMVGIFWFMDVIETVKKVSCGDFGGGHFYDCHFEKGSSVAFLNLASFETPYEASLVLRNLDEEKSENVSVTLSSANENGISGIDPLCYFWENGNTTIDYGYFEPSEILSEEVVINWEVPSGVYFCKALVNGLYDTETSYVIRINIE